VIVRRPRWQTGKELAAAQQAPDAPSDVVDHKSPRTFRIAAAPGIRPAELDESARARGDVEAFVLGSGQPPEVLRLSRRKRATAEQRPGPVFQVFQAPAQTSAAAQAVEATPPGRLGAQVRVLTEKLAALDAVFDEIRRAQALHVQDDSFDAVWYGLSRAADELRGQMQLLGAAGPDGRGGLRTEPERARPQRARRREAALGRRQR
jgi:hypothetical protein